MLHHVAIAMCLVCFAPSLFGAVGDLRLTGLIDIPGCHLACVQKGGAGDQASLRPGESAFGYELKQLDAKSGRALFLRGTNEVWIGLSSSPALATSARVALRTLALPAAEMPIEVTKDVPSEFPSIERLKEPQTSFPGAFRGSGPMTAVEFADPSFAATATGNHSGIGSQVPVTAAPANEGSTPTAIVASLAVSDPGFGSSAQPEHSQSQIPLDASLKGPPNAQELPADGTDANSWHQPRQLTEGERMRIYYGTQAFLTWQLSSHANPPQ